MIIHKQASLFITGSGAVTFDDNKFLISVGTFIDRQGNATQTNHYMAVGIDTNMVLRGIYDTKVLQPNSSERI